MKINPEEYYYENYKESIEYPKIISWENPEDGEERNRVIRNDRESEEFFNWFHKKYPDMTFKINFSPAEDLRAI